MHTNSPQSKRRRICGYCETASGICPYSLNFINMLQPSSDLGLSTKCCEQVYLILDERYSSLLMKLFLNDFVMSWTCFTRRSDHIKLLTALLFLHLWLGNSMLNHSK